MTEPIENRRSKGPRSWSAATWAAVISAAGAVVATMVAYLAFDVSRKQLALAEESQVKQRELEEQLNRAIEFAAFAEPTGNLRITQLNGTVGAPISDVRIIPVVSEDGRRMPRRQTPWSVEIFRDELSTNALPEYLIPNLSSEICSALEAPATGADCESVTIHAVYVELTYNDHTQLVLSEIIE